MKKFFISLIVLVLVLAAAFILQVFYAGSVNAKIYTELENSLQNQKFFTLKESVLEKGFLSSSAKLTLLIAKNDELGIAQDMNELPLEFELKFHNNFLSPHLVSANLKTPEALKKLLRVKDNLAQAYFDKGLFAAPSFKLVLEDMGFETSRQSLLGSQNVDFFFEGAQFLANLNQNYQFTDSELELKKLDIVDKSRFEDTKIQLHNIAIKSLYNKPFSLDEYLSSFAELSLDSRVDMSLESLKVLNKIGEITLENLQSLSISRTDDKNVFINTNLNIASFKATQNKQNFFDIKDFALDLNLSNVSKAAYLSLNELAQSSAPSDAAFERMMADFIAAKPFADFKLTLQINDKKLASSGFAKSLGAEDNFELGVKTTSEALPSEIFPLLALLGADDYFVQKDKIFESSYHFLKEGKSVKIALNGNEIINSFEDESAQDENLNLADENAPDSGADNNQNSTQDAVRSAETNSSELNSSENSLNLQSKSATNPEQSPAQSVNPSNEEALQNLLNAPESVLNTPKSGAQSAETNSSGLNSVPNPQNSGAQDNQNSAQSAPNPQNPN